MNSTLSVAYDQVFIIDCLPEDQYDDLKISQTLAKYLASNGVQQTTSICRSKGLVIGTLQHLVKLAKSGMKFCLHLVSHGHENGLWIETTNEEVSWIEFRSFLNDINKNMNGELILNMTSCMGLHGIKIVDESSSSFSLPFFGLIGYAEDLEVERSKQINSLFYNKLLDGKQVNEAIEEIKVELSDDKIYCISSSGYKAIKNILSQHK